MLPVLAEVAEVETASVVDAAEVSKSAAPEDYENRSCVSVLT